MAADFNVLTQQPATSKHTRM